MLVGEQYKRYVIKEYRSWTLLLHERQHPYVGRCMAWWNDRKPGEGEGLTPLDISGQPMNELLRKVFVDVNRGCKALGYPVEKYGSEFLINMAYLANVESHNHHMHWHFIPRHKFPLVSPQLHISELHDSNWGKNSISAQFNEMYLPEMTARIRTLMARAIGGIV